MTLIILQDILPSLPDIVMHAKHVKQLQTANKDIVPLLPTQSVDNVLTILKYSKERIRIPNVKECVLGTTITVGPVLALTISQVDVYVHLILKELGHLRRRHVILLNYLLSCYAIQHSLELMAKASKQRPIKMASKIAVQLKIHMAISNYHYFNTN